MGRTKRQRGNALVGFRHFRRRPPNTSNHQVLALLAAVARTAKSRDNWPFAFLPVDGKLRPESASDA